MLPWLLGVPGATRPSSLPAVTPHAHPHRSYQSPLRYRSQAPVGTYPLRSLLPLTSFAHSLRSVPFAHSIRSLQPGFTPALCTLGLLTIAHYVRSPKPRSFHSLGSLSLRSGHALPHPYAHFVHYRSLTSLPLFPFPGSLCLVPGNQAEGNRERVKEGLLLVVSENGS